MNKQNEEANSSSEEEEINKLLYETVLDILETKGQDLLLKFHPQFIDMLLHSTGAFKPEAYNIAQTDKKAFYFMGYPACDFVKQLCHVLQLWGKRKQFPVQFHPLAGFTDETAEFIEQLNKLTPLLADVLALVAENGPCLFRDLKDFLMLLEMRGVMTCLGFRKTTGS